MFNSLIIAIIILLILVLFMILFFVEFQRKKRRYYLKQVELENKYQREILVTQIEIQEQTLKNISQEIHDNIGQSLSLVKLNLNTLDLSNPQQAIAKIESTKELVGKSIHDLRDLSRSLNTDSVLANGLKPAIEHELALLNRAGGYQTILKLEGEPARFDAKKELIIFRIFQEAVNNIIKHANASSITVELTYSDSEFSLGIGDNGVGFKENEQDEGSGLRNMKNRAQLIGGEFNLNTGSSGSFIQIKIPLV